VIGFSFKPVSDSAAEDSYPAPETPPTSSEFPIFGCSTLHSFPPIPLTLVSWPCLVHRLISASLQYLSLPIILCAILCSVLPVLCLRQTLVHHVTVLRCHPCSLLRSSRNPCQDVYPPTGIAPNARTYFEESRSHLPFRYILEQPTLFHVPSLLALLV
jgi:hypothetical protein